MPTLTRRLLLVGVGAALVACKKGAPRKAPKEGEIVVPEPAQARTTMPRRPLGRTGLTVSLLGIGGYHLGLAKSDAEASRIVHMALDHGVDFLDNCWDYHDGKSEERMGQALRGGYRDKAFLMTKLDGRTKEKANEQLEQSLRRLGTDRIDLVQVHEVIRMSDTTGKLGVFAPGGAIEALVAAQKAGKIRYLGFTGHKDPAIHLAMIKAADEHGFRFDTVQMPLNVLDAHYKSFEKEVVPVAIGKGMAVLGMKSLGAGKILEAKKVSAIECLQYAMNLPVSVVITGCDSVGVLEQAIHAALTFAPLPPAEVAALLERTKEVAADGKYETFKTTQEHDGTSKHPEWLGTSAS